MCAHGEGLSVAFRNAWSIPPALSWVGGTLQEMCGDQEMLGDILLRGSHELLMGQQCCGFTGLSLEVPSSSLELFKTSLGQPYS